VRVIAPLLLCAGCELAWAQPRPRRRDAGVPRDVGAPVVLRPPAHGRLDPAAVRAVVAGANATVQRCYERALAGDATARGEVEVRVRVGG
jgi:hypothetical protein